MRKSKVVFNSIVSCLIIVSMVASPVFAVSEPSKDLLSPPSFNKPDSASLARQNAIESYLQYAIRSLADKGKDLRYISADDIITIQTKSRRISIVSLSYTTDKGYLIVCRAGNVLYEANVRIAGDEPEISVREAGNIPARFFPAASKLEVPRELLARANEIVADKNYTKGADNFIDIGELYNGLFNVLKTAFVDHDMFSGIIGSGAFFKKNDTYPADASLITGDQQNAEMLGILLKEMCLKKPAAAKDTASICNAIGRVFYIQRRPGYEGAVIFYRLAHEIDPGNVYYHNDWAWSLYHAGMVRESRAELETIIKKDPNMRSLHAEMFYIDIEDANSAIKNLHARRFSSVTAEEFFSETSRIRVLMEKWRYLKNPSFSKYPRTLSGLGKSCNILARLAELESDYLAGTGGDRKKIATLLADAICYVAESAEYMEAGYREASSRNVENQTSHAVGMRQTIMSDNLAVLSRVMGRLSAEGYRLPGRLARVQKAIQRSSRYLGGLDIGFATDFEVALSELDIYCKAQVEAEKSFREAVLKVSETDLSDIDSFLARVQETASSAALAGDIAVYYRNECGLDQAGFAAIFVRYNLLGKEEPSADSIRKYIELTGTRAPENDKEWRSGLSRLDKEFGLGLVTESFSDPEDRSPQKPPVSGSMLDRDMLKGSVDHSGGRSLVSRFFTLKDRIESIAAWSEENDMLRRYFSADITNKIDDIRKRIETYAKGVSDYLEKEKQKGLSAAERDRQRATGYSLTAEHNALRDFIATREKLVDKRLARVSKIIYDYILSVKLRLQELDSKYGGLGSEYFASQVALLNGYIEEVSAIQDADDRSYLSYDDFVSISYRVETAIDELAIFAANLEKLRPYLNSIKSATAEADSYNNLFGRSDVMDEYSERLSEAKEALFDHARKHEGRESLSRDAVEFYDNIALRTETLAGIRTAIVDNLNKRLKVLEDTAERSAEERKNEMRREVMPILNKNVYDKSGSGSVVSRICNLISPAIPSFEEAGDLIKNTDRLIKVLVNTGRLATPAYWKTTAKNFEMIEKYLPGTVTNEIIRSVETHRADLEDIRSDMKGLKISDPDFVSELSGMDDMVDALASEVHGWIVEIYGKWNRVIAAQVSELKDVTMAYLGGWKLERVSDKLKSGIVSDFDELIAALSYDFKDGRDLRDTDPLFGDLRGNLVLVAKANLDNEIAKAELMTLKKGIVAASFYDIFLSPPPSEDMSRYVDMIRLPSFFSRDPSGTVERVNMLFFSTRAKDVNFGEISMPGSASMLTGKYKEDFEIAARDIILKMNRSSASTDAAFSGIRMEPPQFFFFVTSGLSLYEKMRIRYARIGGPDMKDRGPIEIAAAISAGMLDHSRDIADTLIEDMWENDYVAASAAEKRRALAAIAANAGPGGAVAERELIAKLDIYMTGRADMSTYGFYLPERVKTFIENFVLFLNKVTGKDHPLANISYQDKTPKRFFLTMPEEGKKSISSVYPPVKDYAGVYLDTSTATFKIREGYKTAASVQLSETLNESLGAYLEAAAGVGGNEFKVHFKGEWWDAVSGTLKGIKKYAEIEVVVSDGIPTRNSMSISDTIIFDKDFMEYVMRPAEGQASAAIILGERIFHELGLVSYGQDDPAQDMRQLIQKEETDQLYRDVILHARIFSEKSELKTAVDRYTDGIITDSVTGNKAKFSKVFATKDLYLNIQKWAGEVGSSPDKVRAEIKIFVKDFLDNVNVTTRFARFFPAVSSMKKASPEALSTPSAELALATHAAMALKNEETAVLESVWSKDAASFTKTRRIVISSALIPECQKSLITEINKSSADAFAAGYTRDMIEIRPLDYIQSVKSGESEEAVVLLEKSEAGSYAGNESRIIFETDKVDPILLNGLVAAGRAVVYGEMESLRRILLRLGRLSESALPSAVELERMLKEDKLRRLPVIFLPPIKILTSEIGELNRTILKLMQYA